MKNSSDFFNDFDNDFNKMKKWGLIGSIISILFSLGLTGFGIWVIIKILIHFNII